MKRPTMLTMNKTRAPLVALALIAAAALPFAATAQPAIPASAASAASAPVGPVKGPRLLTPMEKRDNAEIAAAPDLRPERPVVPQIRIPLGKKPAQAASAPPPPQAKP